jgi:hypothetical protein
VFFKKQVGYMRKQYPESTDADLVKAKTDFTQGNARNATQKTKEVALMIITTAKAIGI